jgi:HPt (histidine-containing phosphotransfer) domain-containing protein
VTGAVSGAPPAELARLFLERYGAAPGRLRRARSRGAEGMATLQQLAHDLKGTAPLLELAALAAAAASTAALLHSPDVDPRSQAVRAALDRLETTLSDALVAVRERSGTA